MKVRSEILQTPAAANRPSSLVDKAQPDLCATERRRGHLDVVANSSDPSQRDPKNKGDPAIQDHNQRRERSGPRTPMTRVAIRSCRVDQEPTAVLPDLRRGVASQRAAMRTGTGKNPAPKPAESPREAYRSSADEFVRAIGDRTILVRLRSDEIFRGGRILRFPVPASPRRHLSERFQGCFQVESLSPGPKPPFGRAAVRESRSVVRTFAFGRILARLWRVRFRIPDKSFSTSANARQRSKMFCPRRAAGRPVSTQ